MYEVSLTREMVMFIRGQKMAELFLDFLLWMTWGPYLILLGLFGSLFRKEYLVHPSSDFFQMGRNCRNQSLIIIIFLQF